MAGPKSSSSRARAEQPQQQQSDASNAPSGSYKAKLLASSSNDELSAPDQTQEATKPKLPPSKDEGSPPMVPPADAGTTTSGDSLAASSPDDKPKQDKQEQDEEGFIQVASKVQACDAVSAGGAGGDESKGEEDSSNAGAAPITPADVAGDTPAGVALSDMDGEVLTDPSTADLVTAAVMGDTPAGAPTPVIESSDATHPHTAPATGSNVVALPDIKHNQLAKGAIDDKDGSSGSTDAAATAAPGSSDAGGSGSSDSAGDAAAASPAVAAAVPHARARAAAAAKLPEKGGEGPALTPADFAATGLAALEAEADSAAAEGCQPGDGSAAAAAADRSTSVMTDRTDSGWYERSYSNMMPKSAVELAGMDKSAGMEALSERSEDPFSDDPEARKSEALPTEKSESSGLPQGYPALAQAPAVSGDAAAEPAPPQPASAFAADAAKEPEQQEQQGEEGSGAEAGAAGLPRVFAGQGSGKESGRGAVTVNAADLEEGEGEEGPATPPSADKDSVAAAAATAAATGGSTQAEALAGERAEGEEGELEQKVEDLPLPLKVAGGAAKAVIDTVADVGEAVKDVFLGPDV